jgi:hypothetical protein
MYIRHRKFESGYGRNDFGQKPILKLRDWQRQLRERAMKSDELRRRLDKNRKMVPVSIRMPEDVIEDLKRIAPQLGFSGYQPLIRAYIGQGLRQDLMRLENNPGLELFVESLQNHGVDTKTIKQAMADVMQPS